MTDVVTDCGYYNNYIYYNCTYLPLTLFSTLFCFLVLPILQMFFADLIYVIELI